MIKYIQVAMCCLMLLGYGASAETVPLKGSDKALEDLIDTSTLLTVVLSPSGVEDTNLQVIEIGPSYIAFRTQDGARTSYLKDSIQEIRVQEERLEQREMQLSQVRALRSEDRNTMNRAFERAAAIFETASDNQEVRIKAATLMSINNDTDAQEYLEQLIDSNELRTQLDATTAEFLAGNGASWEIVQEGLESGYRPTRAAAAMLAGAAQMEEAIPVLNRMLRDRAADYSAPAARALAHMGRRDIIPQLMTMIGQLNEQKGEAAVYALTYLGGDEVLQAVKDRLPETRGTEQFRLVRVLFELEDPMGTERMESIFEEMPTLAPEAAIYMARRGHWEATEFIRERLERREDPTDANLIYRARYAAALFEGGEIISRAILQELLRSRSRAARERTLDLIVEMNDRAFFNMLQPAIENVDVPFAIKACETVTALGIPQYRNRLLMLQYQHQDN